MRIVECVFVYSILYLLTVCIHCPLRERLLRCTHASGPMSMTFGYNLFKFGRNLYSILHNVLAVWWAVWRRLWGWCVNFVKFQSQTFNRRTGTQNIIIIIIGSHWTHWDRPKASSRQARVWIYQHLNLKMLFSSLIGPVASVPTSILLAT